MSNRRKPTARYVMCSCALLCAFNVYGSCGGFLGSLPVKLKAGFIPRSSLSGECINLAMVQDDATSYITDLNDLARSKVVAKEVETVTTPLPENVMVSSLTMKNHCGELIETDILTINAEDLASLYEEEVESPSWDDKGRINIIRTLWTFLVEEQGVPPQNAAGILGNIYVEGDFSMQEKTYTYISNIEQARTLLGSGNAGYGCAQWSTSTRQKYLLNYYEKLYVLYSDNWTAVRVGAECCMLLEELKAYDVFKDIYSVTSVEDAAGRVALKYEAYSGCESDWSVSNGSYTLVGNGSGKSRLSYAYAIYDYFMK